MECFNCKRMFNNLRVKVTFTCKYSYCEQCLKQIQKERFTCPNPDHLNCKQISHGNGQATNNKQIDKKIQISFIGMRSSGKTTLLQNMGIRVSNRRSTLTSDYQTVIRQVNGLKVEIKLWDTPPASAIIQQQSAFITKKTDFQIIIYRASKIIDLVSFESLVHNIEEKVQRPFMILVNNLQDDTNSDHAEIKKICEKQQWKYLELDCRRKQQADKMWDYLESKIFEIQSSQNKLTGTFVYIGSNNTNQRNVSNCGGYC